MREHRILSDDERAGKLVNKIVEAGINFVHSYDNWFTVAAALKNVPSGRRYFHMLSAIDLEKYDQKACDKQFDSVKPDRGIGVGTLFYLAKQHGITIIEPSNRSNYSTGSTHQRRRKTIVVVGSERSDGNKPLIEPVSNEPVQEIVSKPVQEIVSDPVQEVVQDNKESIHPSDPKRVSISERKDNPRTRWQGDRWDDRIKSVEEIAERFKKNKPSAPIKLDKSTVIIDIDKFIETHLAVVRAHNGNLTFEPYLLRLEKLEELFN